MTDSYLSEDLVTVKWCPLTPDAKCAQAQCGWWDEPSHECAVVALPSIRDAGLVLMGQMETISDIFKHWLSMGIDVSQT